MRRISPRVWIIAAISAVVLLLIVGGGLIAVTHAAGNNSTNTACASQTPTAKAKHSGTSSGDAITAALRTLIAQGISGQVIVPDSNNPGSYVTMAFAKGTINSVNTSSNQLVVQLPNGTTQTFTLSSSTQIQKGKTQGSLSDLQTGMNVLVITRQPQGGTATVTMMIIAAHGKHSSASATATPTA